MAVSNPGAVVLLRCGLHSCRPLLGRSRLRLLATRAGSEGGARAEQLRGPPAPVAQRSSQPSRVKMVSADRDFLLALPGSQQILLHDYRDQKFLKQVSAAGLAGTLMSSSMLAYAVAFNLGPVMYGGLMFQTVGAALVSTMYLRTYVARAILDTRRSRLLITGCSYFGEVSSKDQEVPLMSLEPAANLGNHFIKFRTRSSAFDPSRWFSYRMPRFQEGTDRKPGTSVGFTPVVEQPQASSTAGKLEVPKPKARPGGSASSAAAPRRFPGAGIGVADDDGFGPGGGASAPRVQKPSWSGASAEASEGVRANEAGADKRKTLASLRLQHGLPRDAREEQKILDFLEEPISYAAFTVKS